MPAAVSGSSYLLRFVQKALEDEDHSLCCKELCTSDSDPAPSHRSQKTPENLVLRDSNGKTFLYPQ